MGKPMSFDHARHGRIQRNMVVLGEDYELIDAAKSRRHMETALLVQIYGQQWRLHEELDKTVAKRQLRTSLGKFAGPIPEVKGEYVKRENLTPTPYRAGELDASDGEYRSFVRAEKVDGQPYVAIFPAPLTGDHRDNARRYVALANGCKDIPTAALERGVVSDMLRLLHLAKRWRMTPVVDNDFVGLKDEFDMGLDKVLAKLKVRELVESFDADEEADEAA